MKVCHLINRMIVGGAQVNTLLSACGLHEAGHESVLMTGPSPGPEGEHLRNCGRRDFRVDECPTLCREVHPVRDWQSYRALVIFFKEEKFDIDGAREVVMNGKTGCLLQPGGDTPGVAEISELLLNDAERLAFVEAGQELVKPRFDWRTISDTLIEEYTKHLEIKKKGLPMP